jgi:hypothetical protein
MAIAVTMLLPSGIAVSAALVRWTVAIAVPIWIATVFGTGAAIDADPGAAPTA